MQWYDTAVVDVIVQIILGSVVVLMDYAAHTRQLEPWVTF